MTAHVAPTGVAKTLPSGRIVPVEVAACVPCQWQSPVIPLSLFGWRATDEADRHNRTHHARKDQPA